MSLFTYVMLVAYIQLNTDNEFSHYQLSEQLKPRFVLDVLN